jgi:hypothetical protein
MAARPKLKVLPGLNVWRLLRTDRDGAKLQDLGQTAAAALRYFLGESLSPEPSATLVPTGSNEWRFGNARPVQLVDISRQAGPALPAGELLADRVQTVPRTVPTVRGKRPWWIVIRFWWRGPAGKIDYPAVRSGIIWPSYQLNDADWVLDRAVHVPKDAAPADPGSATWVDAMGDKAQAAFLRATDDLANLLKVSGGGLALVAVLFLLSGRRRRRG